MLTRLHQRIGRALTGCLMVAGPCHAQVGAEEQAAFEAWFRRMVELDLSTLCREPVFLLWRIETPPPSTEFVESLAREIEGKPLHPQRPLYEAIQRAGGKQTWSEFRLWRAGDRWRQAQDSWESAAGFSDRGATARYAWMLTPTQMVKASRGGPSGNYNLARTEAQIGTEVLYFFNGRLPRDLISGPELSAKFDGRSRWSLQFDRPAPTNAARLVARGSFDPAAGWGTIDEMTWTTQNDAGLQTSDTTSLGGWHASALPGLGVCERVSFRSESVPILTRTMTLKEFRRTTAEEVLRMSEPPDVRIPDPVRGAPTFRQIQDFAAGHDGSVEVRDLNREDERAAGTWVTRQAPDEIQRPAPDRSRMYLWILAGLIATALVVLRIRRHA